MIRKAALEKRKIVLSAVLSLLLAFMQVSGWQRSMKYGTSVHTSPLFQRIGVLEGWRPIALGCVEWLAFSLLFYFLFSFLEKRNAGPDPQPLRRPTLFWIIVSAVLTAVYFLYLVGCYPGFFNYDGENQIIQVLYSEVPYDAHHPLLHTLIMGGIVKLGYRIRSADLTFGIFLYCFFQMTACAVSFGYTIRFILQYARNRYFALLAFVFYVCCPPVILFLMSTTKDTLCYAALLCGVLKLYEIYRKEEAGASVPKKDWGIAAVFMTLSCLFRNNISYAMVLFLLLALLFRRRRFRGQICFFISVILLSSLINAGLVRCFDAAPGPVTEALSIPFQQIARLYAEKGEEGFSGEELELLYAAIEPEMLGTYDPVISDSIKYSFWRHLDTISGNKAAYIRLWIKKGLQYPDIYLNSVLDNTYQAWYPGTTLADREGSRYFWIRSWQAEYGRPGIPRLYDFFQSIRYSYPNYPVLRLFFSVGAMLWVTVIAWFYSLWIRDRCMSQSLLLILLLAVTCFAGPVSDVRYYLILFFLFPICAAFCAGGWTRPRITGAVDSEAA